MRSEGLPPVWQPSAPSRLPRRSCQDRAIIPQVESDPHRSRPPQIPTSAGRSTLRPVAPPAARPLDHHRRPCRQRLPQHTRASAAVSRAWRHRLLDMPSAWAHLRIGGDKSRYPTASPTAALLKARLWASRAGKRLRTVELHLDTLALEANADLAALLAPLMWNVRSLVIKGLGFPEFISEWKHRCYDLQELQIIQPLEPVREDDRQGGAFAYHLLAPDAPGLRRLVLDVTFIGCNDLSPMQAQNLTSLDLQASYGWSGPSQGLPEAYHTPIHHLLTIASNLQELRVESLYPLPRAATVRARIVLPNLRKLTLSYDTWPLAQCEFPALEELFISNIEPSEATAELLRNESLPLHRIRLLSLLIAGLSDFEEDELPVDVGCIEAMHALESIELDSFGGPHQIFEALIEHPEWCSRLGEVRMNLLSARPSRASNLGWDLVTLVKNRQAEHAHAVTQDGESGPATAIPATIQSLTVDLGGELREDKPIDFVEGPGAWLKKHVKDCNFP